ncbi:inner membrane protein [Clostridium homopropionicum DSM 5847]|uniref:Inner membrane protein n=1 Tax=Clostridium homopropionicum DSM 5847 TaxID=1121318 RepID=A0A0L6Z9G3_9CLOT|nr:metal-dependent hydrolase [Clostridium homopropionicum]KOA19605.1 inner membrane protein [Clostridium homopropionicum DSM 5847]SFF81938.1 inner membrane protein [Clostridium homopropionicum]
MKGKTHVGIGTVTFMSIYDKIPGGFSYIGLIVVIIGSLLPDIDHPKSIINRYILPFKNKFAKVAVYICIAVVVLYFDYFYTNEPALKALGLCLICIAISSHRNGLTHSLAGLGLFTLVCGYLDKKYNIPGIEYYFMIGYGTHLLCDMITRRGVPLFYPLINKKYRLPWTYNANSKWGSAFEDLLIILGIIYIIYRFPGIF